MTNPITTLSRERLEYLSKVYGVTQPGSEEAEMARALLAIEEQNKPEPEQKEILDYFSSLVIRARKEAEKAIAKFPQPNYVLLKVAEEAGEVVKGAVHYAEGRETWEHVEAEVVQTIAMLFRLVTEGDHVNGVYPPINPSGKE